MALLPWERHAAPTRRESTPYIAGKAGDGGFARLIRSNFKLLTLQPNGCGADVCEAARAHLQQMRIWRQQDGLRLVPLLLLRLVRSASRHGSEMITCYLPLLFCESSNPLANRDALSTPVSWGNCLNDNIGTWKVLRFQFHWERNGNASDKHDDGSAHRRTSANVRKCRCICERVCACTVCVRENDCNHLHTTCESYLHVACKSIMDLALPTSSERMQKFMIGQGSDP